MLVCGKKINIKLTSGKIGQMKIYSFNITLKYYLYKS